MPNAKRHRFKIAIYSEDQTTKAWKRQKWQKLLESTGIFSFKAANASSRNATE